MTSFSISDTAQAAEIVYEAARAFGTGLAATSSFQTQSIPLLHLISRICPNIPIYFLDTGFHFPETLSFRDTVKRQFGLNVISLTPLMGHEAFQEQHKDLHIMNPNMCCYLNKVEPLQRELSKYSAWISGIRRDQTALRAKAILADTQDDGLIKISPMLNWTEREVTSYIKTHELPVHPLHDAGYQSIGCHCCTKPMKAGDSRSGRWPGTEKTECGLHLRGPGQIGS